MCLDITRHNYSTGDDEGGSEERFKLMETIHNWEEFPFIQLGRCLFNSRRSARFESRAYIHTYAVQMSRSIQQAPTNIAQIHTYIHSNAPWNGLNGGHAVFLVFLVSLILLLGHDSWRKSIAHIFRRLFYDSKIPNNHLLLSTVFVFVCVWMYVDFPRSKSRLSSGCLRLRRDPPPPLQALIRH